MEYSLLKSSACAKFIVFGEHSIVTRGRALALPLVENRLFLELEFPKTKLEKSLADFSDNVQKLFLDFLALSPFKDFTSQKVGLSINSQIPEASGLGSSAALCVAAVRALFPNLPMNEQLSLALKGEGIFHSRSSGLDPTVSCIEKPLLYRSVPDAKWSEVSWNNFFKSGYFFALIPTHTKHSTKEVQSAVIQTKQRDPLVYENLMDSLASNTEEAYKALQTENYRMIPGLMNDSHFRLLSLGLSTPETELTLEKVKSYSDCSAAKITGAGQGGYVLTLFRATDEKHQSEIKSRLISDFSSTSESVLFCEI